MISLTNLHTQPVLQMMITKQILMLLSIQMLELQPQLNQMGGNNYEKRI